MQDAEPSGRRRRPDPDADYTRQETKAQRLDRNFAEMLQEVRVAQAGVQILFGFLLSLAFQARFSALDRFQLDVYLVTLIAAALAVTFLTGPVAAHRLLFRRGLKSFLVRYTARLTSIGIGFLAVSVVGGVVLVTDVLLNRPAAISIGAALVLVGVTIWVLIPAMMIKRGRDPYAYDLTGTDMTVTEPIDTDMTVTDMTVTEPLSTDPPSTEPLSTDPLSTDRLSPEPPPVPRD